MKAKNKLEQYGLLKKVGDIDLEGHITSVEKAEDNESIFNLRNKGKNERIKIPFRIHPKLVIGPKIRYLEKEFHMESSHLVGWDTHAGAPDPIIEYFTTINKNFFIEILDGEFQDVKYEKERYYKKWKKIKKSIKPRI